nr:hypothetical protein [Mucilaginibacter celer]
MYYLSLLFINFKGPVFSLPNFSISKRRHVAQKTPFLGSGGIISAPDFNTPIDIIFFGEQQLQTCSEIAAGGIVIEDYTLSNAHYLNAILPLIIFYKSHCLACIPAKAIQLVYDQVVNMALMFFNKFLKLLKVRPVKSLGTMSSVRESIHK